MKGKLLLIAFLSATVGLKAQSSHYLDIGNVKALVYSDAVLFQDIANFKASFEVPKDSGTFSIYSSSFWMSNVEQRNGKPLISSAYDQYGNDNIFSVGPVDIVNQKGDTSHKFQDLWKVNKSTIDAHIQNWNTANYIAPSSIIDWPGNGNSNTAKILAPFADLDNDSIYEPLNGEYPIIKGDQAIFLMVNDYRAEDSTVFNNVTVEYYKPLKIEMHVMLYSFDTTQASIANTVFTNVKIFNRSNSATDDYRDFRFSIYADFDLGNPFDDYVGTDTNHNLFYAYNGDVIDEGFAGNSGYGDRLAVQAVQFLDNEIDHTVYYNIGTALNGDPELPSHIASYQRNEWKNGQKMFYGGNGYNYCVDTNRRASFMFPGDPVLTTDTTQWTEDNPCLSNTGSRNQVGDRRMIGGPKLPRRFDHGQSIELDYAYVFARSDDSARHISDPIAKLRLVADSVQSFFSSTLPVSIKEVKNKEELSFTLFPNPAKNTVQLKVDAQNFEVEIFNLALKKVISSRNQKVIDISQLSNGAYFLKLNTKEFTGVKKLIVVD